MRLQRIGNQLKPPQINSLNPSTVFKMRFLMSSSSVAVTVDSILSAIGNVATTTSNLASIWGSFKITSIEMWAPALASNSPSANTCSVEWIGGQYGLNMLTQDTSNNPFSPAHILSRPPQRSNAAFWQNYDSNANLGLFQIITTVSDTIVDLVVSCKLTDNIQAHLNTSRTGSTVGNVYYCGLDGLSSTGSSEFTVVSLPF